MAKGQRKQKQEKIDKDLFEKLCKLQCPKKEIAEEFNCSEDTIDNWCKNTYNCNFSVIHKKCSFKGKVELREAQFELAKTNTTMAIWLGKQYLGQRDIKETEEETEHEINITMSMPKEEDIERVKRLKEQLFKNDKN